jgi:hypothetical protein
MDTESPLTPLDQVRAKLARKAPPDRPLAAVTFAAAAIFAPPISVAPMARPGVQ